MSYNRQSPQVYNFTFNFSNWYKYGQVCNDGAGDWESLDSDLVFNGTDYWIADQGDKFVYHYNSSCQNQTDGFSITSFVAGFGGNLSMLATVDVLAKKLYLYNYSGSHITNCSLTALASGIVPEGVDIHNDGSIYVIDSSSDKLFKTNTICGNISSFSIGSGTAPTQIAVINDVAYIINEFYSPDLITVYNLSSGAWLENITIKNVLGVDTDSYNGLAINKSRESSTNYNLLEDLLIFNSGDSPLGLYRISKKTANSLSILWNAYACDIYSNCAFNATNYTLNFEEPIAVANETEGRNAIEQGIYNATPLATIYTDLEVDIRYFNGTQDNGIFDKVSFNGTQRWGFNYVTSGESFTNMASSSYNVFNVWENSSLTYNQIMNQVQNFINATLL